MNGGLANHKLYCRVIFTWGSSTSLSLSLSSYSGHILQGITCTFCLAARTGGPSTKHGNAHFFSLFPVGKPELQCSVGSPGQKLSVYAFQVINLQPFAKVGEGHHSAGRAEKGISNHFLNRLSASPPYFPSPPLPPPPGVTRMANFLIF